MAIPPGFNLPKQQHNLIQNWLREIFEDLFSLPFIVLKWEIIQRLSSSELKSCNHFSQVVTGKAGGVVMCCV